MIDTAFNINGSGCGKLLLHSVDIAQRGRLLTAEMNTLHFAALWERGNATAAPAPGGAGVIFRSGRAARWIQRFRYSENRQAARCFSQSLREKYGDHVFNEVLHSSRLDTIVKRGKPLRARHVREFLQQAKSYLNGVRTWNAALARSYVDPGAGNPNGTQFRSRMEREARRAIPGNPTAAGLLDTDAVARSFKAAVTEAGRKGTRLISSNDAAAILSRVVTREISAAFEEASAEALCKLSLDAPHNMVSQALAAAADRLEPPLNLDAARLAAEARDELNRRFRASIADGSIPAHLLKDAASVRALADKVAGDFVEERAGAAKALDDYSTMRAEKRRATLDLVVHDNVPARMVTALARAGVAAANDVAALGTPLRSGELKRRVGNIERTMTRAFAESGLEINAGNQGAMCRLFWRFLLVPRNPAQTRALADRLGVTGSPLRAIGEAANWYRQEFPDTGAAERTTRSKPDSAAASTVRGEGPSPKAARIVKARIVPMLNALVEVANERHDASGQVAPLAANDQVPDQTIAALRNLGIPMPAPNRIGEVNPKVPISTPGIRAIRQELAAHMQSKGSGKLQDGVLQESIKDYDRNTYRIEGRELPLDKAAVVQELRGFCTDGAGRLNEKTLKTLSMIAYQATPGCVLATCLNPLRSEVAIFDGSPIPDPVSRSYNISKNERGDVLVNCKLSGSVIQQVRIDRTGNPTLVETDPSASSLRIDMTVVIDAETAEPELDEVEIGYSLVPTEPPPTPDA